MIPLTAREALSDEVERVTAAMRPLDVGAQWQGARVFAVFDDEEGKFLGLMVAGAGAQFSQRIFVDLLPESQLQPVRAEAPIEDVAEQMVTAGVEVLPVLDENDAFLGAITRSSLLEALLRRDRELLAEAGRLQEGLEAEQKRLVVWAKRLEEVNEASRTLLGLVGQSPVEGGFLPQGLQALATLLQARYGAIGLLSDQGGVQAFVVTGLPSDEAAQLEELLRRPGFLGSLIGENQVLRVADVPTDPPYTGFPPHYPRIKSLLAVPISHQGGIYGRVYLFDKARGEPFTKNDEYLTGSFARSLALAFAHTRELTERQRGEHALRESEAKWRSLVENAPDIILTMDREGKILFINRVPAGLTVDQATGTSALDYVVPEHRHVVRQAIRRVFETGEPGSYEIAARGPHDTTSWYATRLGPVWCDNEVVAALLVTRDITERKRAEEALERRAREEQVLRRLSQTLLGLLDAKAIAQATFEAIRERLRFDAVGLRVPDARGSHLEMIAAEGWMKDQIDHLRVPLEPPELSGAAWAVHTRTPVLCDHTHPHQPFVGHAAAWRAGVKACLHVPMLIQQRVVGVLTINRFTPDAYTDDDVRFLTPIANLVGIALDRAREHQALREAEASYRTLFDGVPVGLFRTTPAGQFLDANAALVEILGYPDREALLAVNTVTLYADPEARSRWQAQIEGDGVVRDFDVHVRRSDGTVIWLRSNARAVRDGEGRALYYEGALEDITERKRAEEARDRLFEQVRAGRERLQALSHRLAEVQEAERHHLARELHDEIGQALTGLKLSLEMSARLPADAARASLDEAQALVNGLLAHVRDLSLDLRPAMLDDLGLLPALLWSFDRYATQTQVRVIFQHTGLERRRFGPHLETATYRIVQEALTNVARHAGVAEATVRIWADENNLGAQIEDRGSGFEVEAVLAAHTSSGLAGMRERAVLLGGQLLIDSAPGRGTRVTLELPLGEPFDRRSRER